MPELPEVETVKNKLKPRLIGNIIKEVTVYTDKIINYPTKELFLQNIKETKFVNINRRGKWLIFELEQYYLVVHLRMEGKFFFKDKEESYNKHEHVIFSLNNDLELRYHDTRKFGQMHLINKDELEAFFISKNLGLEPFDDKLTVSYLKEKFKSKKQAIKSTLLDQSIIVGIGNIYVDEILFLSHINPKKVTNKLKNIELALIIKNTRKILKQAIELEGTTIYTYSSLDGIKGMFQNQLLVHNKKGEPCSYCGTIIEKIKVGGRGTCYCPQCQK